MNIFEYYAHQAVSLFKSYLVVMGLMILFAIVYGMIFNKERYLNNKVETFLYIIDKRYPNSYIDTPEYLEEKRKFYIYGDCSGSGNECNRHYTKQSHRDFMNHKYHRVYDRADKLSIPY